MKHLMKHVLFIFIYSCTVQMVFSQNYNEAIEPTFESDSVINLLKENKLDAWEIPSDLWYIENETIIGHTGDKKLNTPEWLYTKQQFSDFEFTCELRLTGDNHRNTGIYYRVKKIIRDRNGNKSYETPSGYEFDAAFHIPGETNFRGTLGDWYARPSLRIFPDQSIINNIYKTGDWNRMTLRARGNRLEYWLNGIKVMDFVDHDPKASRNGIIGFQIHNGSVMKVEYRNILVLPLK